MRGAQHKPRLCDIGCLTSNGISINASPGSPFSEIADIRSSSSTMVRRRSAASGNGDAAFPQHHRSPATNSGRGVALLASATPLRRGSRSSIPMTIEALLRAGGALSGGTTAGQPAPVRVLPAHHATTNARGPTIIRCAAASTRTPSLPVDNRANVQHHVNSVFSGCGSGQRASLRCARAAC